MVASALPPAGPFEPGKPELVFAGHEGMARALAYAAGALFFVQAIYAEGQPPRAQLVTLAPKPGQKVEVVGPLAEHAQAMTMENPVAAGQADLQPSSTAGCSVSGASSPSSRRRSAR